MMQIWRELLNSLVVSLGNQLLTPFSATKFRKRRLHSTAGIAPRFGNQAEALECRTLLSPFVSRIDRITPLTETTDSPTVTYRVEFDEDVSGVDISDFQVTTQGSVSVAAPVAITPESSSAYLVTIAGISGSGELRLDLIDDDSINSEGVLGGQGIGNGSFQGESYFVRQTQPVVLTLERTLPAEQTTEASAVTFTIAFDRPVTGVDSSDFEFVTTGNVTSAVPLSVTGSGAVYEITVSEISGIGTLGLKFTDNNTVRDVNGNPLAPASHETIFAPTTVMGTGGTPNYVALGDLDRDGNLDLITANRNQGLILVSMGNGDGTFQMELASSAGGSPSAIVVADVNGDGLLDVVSLNPNNNGVTLLRGLGNGTFATPFSLGETAEGFTSPNFYFLPGAIAVRDVSNDGTADIVVTDSYDQSVNITLGYGGGEFFNDGSASTGNDPSALKLEDVNRDGYMDLIVALRGSNQVQVLLKVPDLGYEVAGTFMVGNQPNALAVRDVNGDGWADIITANEGDNTISVLLTDDMGVYGAAQSIPVGSLPRNLEVLDVNGDGRNDIVVSNQNSSTMSVLNGLGGGIFQPATTFTVGGTPTNIAWGDIDGDGRIDLVTGDIETNAVRILRNAAFGDVAGQTYEITAAHPVFTSPDHAEVDENFPVSSVVLDVRATPAQPGYVAYIISGPDRDLFTLDGETRELRFNFSPDYESPLDFDSDNVYRITITAVDGNELSTDQDIAITVLPVNDNAPMIEPQPTVNVPENTLPATVVLTALGTDADLPMQSLVYSLGGPDSSRFSIDPGTGQIRFLESPDFELPADDDQNNIYRITVSVADGGGNTASLDHLIEVMPVNEANPTITSSATAEIVEGQSAETIVLTVVATDSDLPAQSLSFSLVGTDSELFNIDSQSGAIRFNNSPSFSSPVDSDGDNVYRFNVIVADGNGGFTDQLTFITVTPSNTSPFFAAPSVDVSIDENWPVETFVLATSAGDLDTPAQVLTYSLSGEDHGLFTIDPLSAEIRFVSSPDYELPFDADGDNVYRVSVTVDDGNGGLATQDVVITVLPVNDLAPVITSSSSVYIPETWPTSSVVMTATALDGDFPSQLLTFSLTGVDADLFQIDTNTGEIRFLSEPDYENPDDADGDRVYRLVVHAFDGNGLSGVQDLEILLFPYDDNPTVITSPDTVNIPENTSTETVVLAITVTDADLPAESFYYEIYEGDAEQFSIDPYSGQIRFLNSPDYENPIDSDGDNIYQFQVYIYGSSEQLTIHDVTITVLPVNESIPEIISGGTTSVIENTSSESVLIQVQAVDGDLPTESLTFTLSGADALLFNLDNLTGELRFVSSPDFELPQSAAGDNVYRAIVTASDGTLSSTQDLVVTVLPVNDHAPAIASAGSVNVAENTSSNVVVLDVDGVDSDLPSGELTYTITGADGALFSIDSTSGEIRFLSSPDYEDPQSATGDNIYRVLVTVSDGTFMTSQDVVVTVLPVNDNVPVIVSSGSASVNENTAANVVILEVNASDDDLPGTSVNYSLTGADATSFSIDPLTGEVRFVSVPDFELPQSATGDNVYRAVVTVSDGTFATSQDVVVTVLPLNDNAPVITSAGSTSIDENTDASIVVLDVNALDADLPSSLLNYSITGADAAMFSIESLTGEIRFVSSPDFELPQSATRDNVYRAVVTISDGTYATSQDIVVTVQPVNEHAPVITSSGSASIDENTNSNVFVLDVNAIDSDLPSVTLSYSINGTDAALFQIDSLTGEVRFLVSPDFELPRDDDANQVYQFSVVVTDGDGLSVTQSISISVLPLNDNPPILTSPLLLGVAENETFLTYLSATDLDLPNQTLSYAISGGADQALFGIEASTGRLYFLNAPDFESPLDDGHDQNYEIIVTALDGQGLSADQALTIQVLPINDNSPVFVSTGSIELNENVSLVGIIGATDADLPSGGLHYSIVGGADSGRFSINAVTGSLSFQVAPNFEQPVDVGLDNVYEVTISADDGLGRSTTLPIEITVLNRDEGLAIYLPSSPPTFNRTGPVTLDPAAYIEDPDTEIPDLRNRTLTITLDSPDSNDEIYVATQGNGPGRVSVLFGNIVYESSLVIIGTMNGTDSRGQLIIRFTSFATPVAVNALLRAISFRSTSDSQISGNRNVTFEISDEAGPGTVTNSKPVDVVPIPVSVPLHSDLAEAALSQMFTANESSEFQAGRLNVDFGRNFNRKDRLTLRSDLGITVRGKDISYQGQKIGRIVRKGKSLQVEFSSSAASGTAVKAVIESVALKAPRGRQAAPVAECDFMLTLQRDGVETLFGQFSFSIPSA